MTPLDLAKKMGLHFPVLNTIQDKSNSCDICGKKGELDLFRSQLEGYFWVCKRESCVHRANCDFIYKVEEKK